METGVSRGKLIHRIYSLAAKRTKQSKGQEGDRGLKKKKKKVNFGEKKAPNTRRVRTISGLGQPRPKNPGWEKKRGRKELYVAWGNTGKKARTVPRG